MIEQKKFFYQIDAYHYESRTRHNGKQINQKRGHFQTKSLQAAKSRVSRTVNTTELFSYIQSWDNEKQIITGKDIRWRKWTEQIETTSIENNPIKMVVKSSERMWTTTDNDYYQVVATLYWEIEK